MICSINYTPYNIIMQPSPDSLKEMEKQINKVRNRLRKLQKRSEGQRHSASHHQVLKDEVLKKKIAMAQSLIEEGSEMEEYKRKQAQRLNMLKQQNQRRRSEQKEEINNVMKAIYFVKADDAREARRISAEHKNKIKEINQQSVEASKSKRERVRSQTGKAEKYWKDKFYKIYLDNQVEKIQNQRAVSSKQKELEDLKKKQNQYQQELHKNEQVSFKSKKQLLGVSSLPIRQVASVLELHGSKKNQDNANRAGSGTSVHKKAKSFDEHEIPEDEAFIFPKTQVNEAKLRIILERLRKKQK